MKVFTGSICMVQSVYSSTNLTISRSSLKPCNVGCMDYTFNKNCFRNNTLFLYLYLTIKIIPVIGKHDLHSGYRLHQPVKNPISDNSNILGNSPSLRINSRYRLP